MPSLRLLVVGASQGTGALTVSTALEHGHQVTALSRSPQKLTIEHASLVKRAGSFHAAADVDAAVAGHDAVIITAAPSSLAGFKENPTYFSAGTALVVEAMKRHSVRRLVVLSSLGTAESRVLQGWFIRTLLLDGLLKLPTQDHAQQEALTRGSDLEWVIARPGASRTGRRAAATSNGRSSPPCPARSPGRMWRTSWSPPRIPTPGWARPCSSEGERGGRLRHTGPRGTPSTVA